MPTKIERLLFTRKKLTQDLKRLHSFIQACNSDTKVGTLVSYRKALEDCWAKYDGNNDEIENSKDSPCDDDFIAETGSMNDLYLEAQATLVENTPTNSLHDSLKLYERPKTNSRTMQALTEEEEPKADNVDKESADQVDEEESDDDSFVSTGGVAAVPHNFARPSASSTPQLTAGSGLYASVKLPPLEIKHFSGDKLDWPEFRSMCEATFAHMEGTNKFRYLKCHLDGEAARLIRHLPICPASYELAWAILERRYDNQRAIINANLARLFELTEIQKESADSLKALVDTTNECIAALESFDIDTSSWNSILVFMLSRKLDHTSIKYWEEHVQGDRNIPSIDKFLSFLDIRINILETTMVPGASNTSSSIKNRPKVLLATDRGVSKAVKCGFCSEEHRTFSCPQFTNKTVRERREWVQSLKLCYNCLYPHSVTNCTSKFSCRTCGQRHHSLLHETNQTGPSIPSNIFSGNLCNKNFQVLLATAMVRVCHNGRSMLFKALIDQGSMTNLITKRASEALQLPLENVDIPILGVGEVVSQIRKCTEFDLSPHFESGESLRLDALVLPKITTLNVVPKSSDWKHLDNIQLADPHIDKNGRIDILIGANTFSEILLNGVLKGEECQPIAQNTKLGWIMSGKTKVGHAPITPIVSIVTESESISDSIKKFWESEDIPEISQHFSEEEMLAERIFIETTQRCDDGRFMVKLPFKSDPVQSIGESLFIAKRRLSNSLIRLSKRPEFKAKYDQCIQEYLDLNQMEQVDTNQKPYYYLPHHAVIKESSTTTSTRPVFDGSCKTDNGNSLNSELLVGPTIQSDLFSLLIHWRKFQFAITGDIEKMYRQIWVYPEDSQFQRILWQPPCSSNVNSYRLKTVTFGVASSAFLAIRSLHQVGENLKSTNIVLAEKIQKQFYVDDFLDSCTSPSAASQTLRDVTAELAKYGMKLRKWKTNAQSILDDLPESEKEIGKDQDTTFKTLGIQWQPTSDMFVFLPMNLNEKIGLTKRCILSDISKLFDPLGWLSPCIVLAKAFMQRLWLLNLGWDTPIPDEQANEWLTIRFQFEASCSVAIPRWIGLSNDIAHISLQGFCDASEKAFACVVYLRIIQIDRSITCNLIAAKTKIAPLKTISIPKLELEGAVLLTKLLGKIKNALRMPDIQHTAWSDSFIVLCWLSSPPSRWKTYVANRVSRIQTQLPSNDWRHIASKLNPADCASRGMIREDLEKFELWWKGPEFLLQDETTWPNTEFRPTNLEERKPKTIVSMLQIEPNSFILRFSSYSRLLRVASYCFKWLHFRSTTDGPSDLTTVEMRLIKIVQNESFSEITSILNQKPIDPKSSIRNLDPFLDSNGILRVGGRLQQSSLSEGEKFPIILPPKHHFTTILIRHEHSLLMHGGLAIVLQKLRQRFWIVNAKTTVNSVIRRCVICFRHKRQLSCQKMGNIPSYRLAPAIPFTYTGVDYAGYFNIKSSSRKNAPYIKGYISLFICLTSRAIHLELVSDLSAEQFLKAFKRFVSRRGIPSEMHSDNGTNFVKAAKLLDEMFSKADLKAHETNERFLSWLQSNRIKWSNIPPHAPHFGGWESGVKLVKFHLKRVLGEVRLNFEDFNTTIIEIEAIVNSRPLWSIPTKVDEFEALTPGHFLVFKALNALPEPDLSHLASNRLNQYQYLCRLVSDFWKLWSKEYCHRLQIRKKWKTAEPNIQPNQLVLIVEDNEAPTQWSLARVSSVVVGKDGLVRVANLLISTGDNKDGIRGNKIIQRSIHRLSLLPIPDNA